MDIRESKELTTERARQRLDDWRKRVHALYDAIQEELEETDLTADRNGKHQSYEEVAQRAGIARHDIPELDILRIVRPNGLNAAMLVPRGLWVIGANGRIDLRIMPTTGGSETYLLLDESEPLQGPAHWIRSRITTPFEREPFDPKWLRARLLEHGS
jgi:hypothetical protein